MINVEIKGYTVNTANEMRNGDTKIHGAVFCVMNCLFLIVGMIHSSRTCCSPALFEICNGQRTPLPVSLLLCSVQLFVCSSKRFSRTHAPLAEHFEHDAFLNQSLCKRELFTNIDAANFVLDSDKHV